MKNPILIFSFLFIINISWSQEYKNMMLNNNYTVQEVQNKANAYFDEFGITSGINYKEFKRWEYNALRLMDEDGFLKSIQENHAELERYNNYLNNTINLRGGSNSGNWEELGPTSSISESPGSRGIGRITSIAFVKNNPNHFIVGAETGGVWKTKDGGQSWEVLTDDYHHLSVYALAIDPNDSSTYYWGTIGGTIFASHDEGATWDILGSAGNGLVNKIVIDPDNSSKMYCSLQSSGDGGLMKSVDGGMTWALLHPDAPFHGYDIEFKPGNSNVVYASGNQLFKSIDGGDTFTNLNDTNPLGDNSKMMAVSQADPSVLYVLDSDGVLFKSLDEGESFDRFDHSGDNYLGDSFDGSPSRSQAPRDMDIAVSPTNINEVHIAGINTWRSLDGGLTFELTAYWHEPTANAVDIGFCHADVDILAYIDDNLFAGTDGGIFKASNPTAGVNQSYFTDLSIGLGIRQFTKIGVSQTNPVNYLGGSQDNATSVLDQGLSWLTWSGGDGGECFVDKENNNILYGTAQRGSMFKSLNGGITRNTIPKPSTSAAWIIPFEQDPYEIGVIYSGFERVYKSINGGDSWTPISQDFGSVQNIIAIAPSDNNVIYTSRGSRLYRTTDGGLTDWIELLGFSDNFGRISAICVHPNNPTQVAIAVGDSEKVFISSDGGDTWQSYQLNLPDFSALTLVWADNEVDGLYLGMSQGIYYIDDTMSEWIWFGNNLPNAMVNEIEINHAEDKIYAGTYGRGLWVSPIYNEIVSSTDPLGDDKTVTIYPSPASDKINIVFSKAQNANLKIYDARGKMMINNSYGIDKSEYMVDVSLLPSGIYFVRIHSDEGLIIKKFIKN